MAFLKYIGGSHFRTLLKEDFAKVEVQVEEALTFARHEVVKVSTEVADAIHQLVGDEFEEVKEDVNEELARDAEKDPNPTNVVPGAYVPPATVPVATTDAPNDADQPTPSEQSPAEVEGPGATA